MSFHRHLLALVLATLPIAAACAPPTPDDAVGDSEGAATEADVVKISDAKVQASGFGVNETVFFSNSNDVQKVDVCHANQDGTDEQKHRCDHYPVNYETRSCMPLGGPRFESGPTCRNYNLALGAAPYDQGDGTYEVFFVNHGDPADRKEASIRRFSDFFQLGLDLGDYPKTGTVSPSLLCKSTPKPDYYRTDLFTPIEPGTTTTTCPSTLRIKLSVKAGFAGQVKGCATGFSTEGLSRAEIAAKDAEQIALCEANATNTLERRAGWIKYVSPYVSSVETLSYDASALLSPHLHLIFSFAIGGRVQSYVFDNDFVP